MKKILLINPPGILYQRGEDRCQANIKGSAAVSLRACNDLGYMAAVARRKGFDPVVIDYMAEGKGWESLESDLLAIKPDLLIMSIVTATLKEDMQVFDIARKRLPEIICIAKGAHFFTCELKSLESEEFLNMDYALYGEAEVVLLEFLDLINNNANPKSCRGIIHRENRNETKLTKNPPSPFLENLDILPFPARDLMRNELYVRPDTGKPQATIQTSRGCPAACIYCLTPIISGKPVRKRSAVNIVDEIEECVERHGIRDFFFRADTFTIDKKWVLEVCNEIIKRKLNVEWVANSRVKPLEEETLIAMKKAGCWLIALGIESGSEETLKEIKKGATVGDAVNAVALCKKTGIRTYGFYLIGFPWENHEHVRETIDLALRLDCDFAEFHIATPYEGTALHEVSLAEGLLSGNAVGHDYFTNPIVGTKYLSRTELLQYRNEAIRRIYFRPKYIFRTLLGIRSPQVFLNYFRYGLRMLANHFK